MRRTATACVGWALVAAASVFTTDSASADGGRFFDPTNRTGFGALSKAVEHYLTRHGATGLQHVCALGVEDGGEPVAWVRWDEGRRLVLFEPPVAEGSVDALYVSRRDLSLDDDVVDSLEAVGSSTYLVTQSWVESIRHRCIKGGARWTVRPGRSRAD